MCPQVDTISVIDKLFEILLLCKCMFQSHVVICFVLLPSIQEFVKGCGSVTKRWVDGLLDKMTAGDHSKAVNQIRQVYDLYLYSYFIYMIAHITHHIVCG